MIVGHDPRGTGRWRRFDHGYIFDQYLNNFYGLTITAYNYFRFDQHYPFHHIFNSDQFFDFDHILG